MSSKIKKQALVLIHVEDVKKYEKIVDLCGQLGLAVKKINSTDKEKTIAQLSGVQLLKKKPGREQQDRPLPYSGKIGDILIFSGLSNEGLDLFLDGYRKAEIPPTSLKAMVTPHNAGWTLAELYTELLRERTSILLQRT